MTRLHSCLRLIEAGSNHSTGEHLLGHITIRRNVLLRFAYKGERDDESRTDERDCADEGEQPKPIGDTDGTVTVKGGSPQATADSQHVER